MNEELRRLESLTRTHVCHLHPELELVVATEPGRGIVLKCGAGHVADVLQKRLSPTQAYRRGLPIPISVKNNIERRESMTENARRKESAAPLSLLPVKVDVGSGAMITHEQAEDLLALCDQAHLKPWLNHVCIYHGKPWVTIDGWYYLAHRSGHFRGLTARPLGEDAKKELGFKVEEHVWKAFVWRNDFREPFVGYGRASEDEQHPVIKGSFVEPRFPQRMAEKRAEEDALRKAFPLGLGEEKDG